MSRMNPTAMMMYSKKEADANTRVRVGVAVIIRDSRGRILLEKRSDCKLWGLPGGRIEPGESITDAAVREAREETGFTVQITRLLGVYSEPGERIVTFPDNGDVVHLVDILLEGAIVSGQLSCSHESEELRFFDPDGLPTDLAPPSRVPLRDVVRGDCATIG